MCIRVRICVFVDSVYNVHLYTRMCITVFVSPHLSFVRTDELREAWRIFTPLLDTLEKERVAPIPYAFGSSGPQESYELIRSVGYKAYEGYRYHPHLLTERSQR